MEDGRLYRPCNGSEGEWFEGQFCDRCKKDAKYRETLEDGCDIHTRAIAFDIEDPEYPGEWRYGDDGAPTCSAFEKEEGWKNLNGRSC